MAGSKERDDAAKAAQEAAQEEIDRETEAGLVSFAYTAPQKRVRLNLSKEFISPGKMKIWCFDWNLAMELKKPHPSKDPPPSKSSPPNELAFASCGEGGLTIWAGKDIDYRKKEHWSGEFRSCAWHPLGEMIAGGTFSAEKGKETYVHIWNYTNRHWNDHSKIRIEGSTGDVVDLSWNGDKLLFCTTDGHFYVIQVEISGGHHVLATCHDDTNAQINFVKWIPGFSNYFICGGHRGLEIYSVSEIPESSSWKIEKRAVRKSTSAAAGICFDPHIIGSFAVFKFSGGIKTWRLKITKDYMGCDLISLNFELIHGKRENEDVNMKTPTDAYFSFDWNRYPREGDRYMAFGREDGRIEIYTDNIWNEDEYYSIGVFSAHTDSITCVKWMPSHYQENLITASFDGSIRIWKVVELIEQVSSKRTVEAGTAESETESETETAEAGI